MTPSLRATNQASKLCRGLSSFEQRGTWLHHPTTVTGLSPIFITTCERRNLCIQAFGTVRAVHQAFPPHSLTAMAAVNVLNINVLDNPCAFTNPLQFEVTFECLAKLTDGAFKAVEFAAAGSART